MKSTTASVLIVAGLLFLLLICTPLGFYLYIIFFIHFDQNAGTFNRGKFEAVVAEVRARGLKPGESVEWRLDDISNPKTLRPLKPNEIAAAGFGEGKVWAVETADGKLNVVIETKDLGHAGEYGFAYSEEPIASSADIRCDRGWRELDLPGHLRIVENGMKIDDHWWEVCDNMN